MTLEKVTNLINGKFKPALDGDEIDIIDPSTDLFDCGRFAEAGGREALRLLCIRC